MKGGVQNRLGSARASFRAVSSTKPEARAIASPARTDGALAIANFLAVGQIRVEKSVAARRRNQHARRVRSPEKIK
jgi:hypothetical protein